MRLRDVEANMLGVVVNRLSPKTDGYNYYYNYYYYRKSDDGSYGYGSESSNGRKRKRVEQKVKP
jgi:hypothetical protein